MLLNYLLTALAPLVGGGNFFANSKPAADAQFFSKDYTTMLKGVCCILVVYVHFQGSHVNALQDAIGSFAYIAVTLFFLISAYGMMLSAKKSSQYLRHFWRNRLASLLVPCVCVNIVGFALSAVEGQCDVKALYEVNEYVLTLLQFCLWFFIVEWCKQKWFPANHALADALLIGGVVVSSAVIYLFLYHDASVPSGWCFERMGLVWGILLYRHYHSFVAWMGKHRLAKAIVLCLLAGALGVAYLKCKTVWFWGEYLLKIVLGAAIILFFFTATSGRKVGNAFGAWLGGISFEVYLSHEIVMGLIACFLPTLQSGGFILLTIIATALLSWAVHAIDKPIVARLRA